MKKLEINTTDGRIITVDISNEVCLKFGFAHNEIAIRPDGLEATIMGVAPGNQGDDVLWYIINHPRTEGLACYWDGAKNLLKVGFKKLNNKV